MSKLAQDIVLRPIITEESMAGGAQKKYCFEVTKDANKPEIAKAVEKLFGVQVAKVNTLNVKGHLRRYGQHQGYKPDWKKAVVTLAQKSKTIEFFDGIM
jgi:large subunit ribosomal protein L23